MPVHSVFPAGVPNVSASDILAGLGLVLHIEVNVPQSLAGALAAASSPLPPPVPGMALIDTGATSCCMEESVLAGLGLQPVDQVHVTSPNGPRLQNVYIAQVSFPGSPIPTMDMRLIGVQMGNTGQRILGLIGRDVLRNCVLVYNGPMGSYTIAF